jgi:hypothetical protein
VFTALTLLVLMLFAAFAVDMGLVMNERRQDQGAVDSSATSGAVIALQSGDLQLVVNEILSKATFGVDRPISNTQWTACEDEELFHTATSLGLTPRTECISWSQDFKTMRVRVPEQSVDSAFAGVIGLDSLTTDAFAEIEFVPRTEGGAALPFVVLAGASGGQHICIRTDSADNPPVQMVGNGPGVQATVGVAGTPGNPRDSDPCDKAVYDPASSTFGTLTPRDYLNGCDTQNDNVVEAIMEGTDHPTGFFADPPFTIPPGGTSSGAEVLRATTDGDVRVDGPGPSCRTFMPNTIKMNSGLTTGDLRCALISLRTADTCTANGTALTPRLRQGSGLQANVFLEETINNTPAWAYLSASTNLPTSCKDLRAAHMTNNPLWDFYDRRETFLSCLNSWNASTHDQIFTEDIGSSPRFAYVPQLGERRLCDAQDPPANCTPALNFAHVNSYAPVFLNKLYSKDGNNKLGCEVLDPRDHAWFMHEAGQNYGVNCGRAQASVDRLSAIVLDCAMLPKSVCDPDLLPGLPGNDGSIETIFEAHLSR